MIVCTCSIPTDECIMGMTIGNLQILDVLASGSGMDDDIVQQHAIAHIFGYLESNLIGGVSTDELQGLLFPDGIALVGSRGKQMPIVGSRGAIIDFQSIAIAVFLRFGVGERELRLKIIEEVHHGGDKTRDKTHLLPACIAGSQTPSA